MRAVPPPKKKPIVLPNSFSENLANVDVPLGKESFIHFLLLCQELKLKLKKRKSQ
jgi:hypothetical protein